MKKEKPTLKKVKIDDHIRASNNGNSGNQPRKRGRPRKNPESFSNAGKIDGPGSASISDTLNSASETHDSPSHVLPEVEPVYDTTEEAKGFLRAPFDIVAGLSGIPKIALYPSQLDALAPSFKIVYDKRIAPKLGEDADLIAFAVVASGVIFEKIAVFKEESEKTKIKSEEQNQKISETPYIPTIHNQ